LAIYRLEVKPISRSGGRSIVAAAAYRSGQELTNPRDGLVHDYTRRHGVEHSELVGWEGTRQELWGRTEEIETRKNARLGVETIVALPHELSAEDRRELTAAFAQELSAAYRAPVDFSIHAPHEKGDERNHHAHILVGARRTDGRELGERVVPFDGPEAVERWRTRWAELSNERLRDRGLEQRVDHRSLAAQREAALERGEERKAQDLDRTPQPKVGPTATAMERRGIQTDRGDRRREVLAQNAERQGLWQRVREWGQQLGERARDVKEDVAERVRTAFGWTQDPGAGEQGAPKSLDVHDQAERLKAAFREKREAKRLAEAMRPFEQQADRFVDIARGGAKPNERRVWDSMPASTRNGIQAGLQDFNQRDDAGKAAFKADLANGLAQQAGVRPPRPPSPGGLALGGAVGLFMQAVTRAAQQSQPEPTPAPSLSRPTESRSPERKPYRGPQR
jgi:hypothetical protein